MIELPPRPGATSRMYGYVRARQLEGTYSDDPKVGAWVQTHLRIAKGWGSPPEAEWPYNGRASAWPPREPPNIDTLAKAFRLASYQRVRTVEECQRSISRGFPVQVALRISRSAWKRPQAGYIRKPDSDSELDGSHSVLVVGYDRLKRVLKFLNSWGAKWGKSGYGFLSNSYFSQHQSEAWVANVDHVLPPMAANTGQLLVRWGVAETVSSGVLHGMEIVDATFNDSAAWALVVERQGFADVEELFVRPAYRGQGLGKRLADEIGANAALSNLAVRVWISHADGAGGINLAQAALLGRLGLRANPTPRKWASMVAM